MSARNLTSLILAESDNSDRKRAVQVKHVLILLTRKVPLDIVERIMSFNIIRVDVVVDVRATRIPTSFDVEEQDCVDEVLDWTRNEIEERVEEGVADPHVGIQAVEISEFCDGQQAIVDYRTGASYEGFDTVMAHKYVLLDMLYRH